MNETFDVTGHAFVPNRFRIRVQAKDADAAMRKANRLMKQSMRSGEIITGTEDEGAAFGFDALDATPVKEN